MAGKTAVSMAVSVQKRLFPTQSTVWVDLT